MAGSIRYARIDDASIAYRVLGDRGPYLALLAEPFPGLLLAEHPVTRASVERASRFSRPVVLDVQGSGRSDPLPPGVAASVEHEAAQLIAVLVAAEIDSAYLLGIGPAGAVCVSVAVRRPDLVSGLVLANSFARELRDDDYPWGIDRASKELRLRELHDLHGTGFLLDLAAPSVAHDPEVREFWVNCEEQISSPAQALALYRMTETLDVRSLLPQVHVPTLVIHSADNTLFPIDHGRYLAEHIPNARFVEVPGRDHIFLWESGELFYDEVEAFVTGTRPSGKAERALAAVLFTDIVASTEHARTFGNHRWRRVLDECERVSREQIERYRGRLVKYTGDGVLATFGSASDAIRCALSVAALIGRLGVDIHSGVHVGDIERRGDDIAGTTVNVASRVMDAARPREVLVTNTARDAAAASGIRFTDAGSHQLKGLTEAYLLFRAERDEG